MFAIKFKPHISLSNFPGAAILNNCDGFRLPNHDTSQLFKIAASEKFEIRLFWVQTLSVEKVRTILIVNVIICGLKLFYTISGRFLYMVVDASEKQINGVFSRFIVLLNLPQLRWTLTPCLN